MTDESGLKKAGNLCGHRAFHILCASSVYGTAGYLAQRINGYEPNSDGPLNAVAVVGAR